MVAIFFWACPRVDDEHQHDADDDGYEGRPQVVGDGQDSQPTACLCVHGWQAGHKTGWDYRKRYINFKVAETVNERLNSFSFNVCFLLRTVFTF